MRLVDRYLAHHVWQGILLVILVLSAIWSFLDLVEELPKIGQGTYHISKVLMYIGLSLPMQIYQFFPIAALIGSLLGLGRLAQSSQLLVMQTAGVSVARLTWGVIKASLLLCLIMLFLGGWFAPHLKNIAERIKQHALGTHYSSDGPNIWLARKNYYFQIDKISSGNTINGLQIFQFNQQKLTNLITAKTANYLDQKWWLHDVVATQFKGFNVVARHYSIYPFYLSVLPSQLTALRKNPDQLSLGGILSTIHQRLHNGLVVDDYSLEFWQRLMQPITVTVLICLAVPFMFGSLRNVNMATRLLVGIIVGFIMYMLNHIFGPIMTIYQFSPLFAALLPTGLFFLGYLFLFKKINR